MYVRKAMHINSKVTSAIVDSLLRLVQDGLALHGPVGARHQVLREQLESRLLFGLLSGCCKCVVFRSIDRSAWH